MQPHVSIGEWRSNQNSFPPGPKSGANLSDALATPLEMLYHALSKSHLHGTGVAVLKKKKKTKTFSLWIVLNSTIRTWKKN